MSREIIEEFFATSIGPMLNTRTVVYMKNISCPYQVIEEKMFQVCNEFGRVSMRRNRETFIEILADFKHFLPFSHMGS